MTADRIRTTISLSPEAYEIFKRMAAASNTSVSRVMGDWLTDTADAATMITLKMEEAKKAPVRVMRELQAMVSGMGQEVDSIIAGARSDMQERRQSAAVGRASGTRAAAGKASSPPSSNTGGKSPSPKTPKTAKVSKK